MTPPTSITVERAGLLTTVQDRGRPGHQHEGVPVGGAMDDEALRLANLLVGNDEGAAAIEATLDGPTLRFSQATLVAVTGADMNARADDRPLVPWRSAIVPAGGTLTLGTALSGCRAYVAIAGGIDVAPVLGSRSTYTIARFGGHEGRALRRGDVLHAGTAPVPDARRAWGGSSIGARGIPPAERPSYGGTLRFVAGPDLAALTCASRARLLEEPFRVSMRSDRMGVRLEAGEHPLAFNAPIEPLSAGVAMGTLQLPPSGEPIILAADRQTTGGYPRLGDVATVDLPALAQLRPGDSVRLAEIPLAEAQRLYLARQVDIAALRRTLAFSP